MVPGSHQAVARDDSMYIELAIFALFVFFLLGEGDG